MTKETPKVKIARLERELKQANTAASRLFDHSLDLQRDVANLTKELANTQPKVLSKLEQRAADIAESMKDQADAWHTGYNDSDVPAEKFAEYLTVNALQYLQDGITLWAISKGWLTEEPRNPAEQLMLIVTELAEACEAFRVGNPPCERPGMEHYSHAAEELADVVIRCFQMAGEHDIPLPEVIQAKMAFNQTRPTKHGKKF